MSLAGWQFNEKSVINHNLIDGNLTNFPHLVKLTSSNFDFSKAQTNGEDIRFTDAAGNLLSYERERHDSTNEKAEYWVKIPSVSSTVDTTIWMYFGNASATDGADPTNVWDSGYRAVYHMNQDPSGTAPQILDSTSNNNDGTSYGSMTSTDLVDGQVGKALDFDGSDDYIDIGAAPNSGGSAFTISAWIKADTYNYSGEEGIISEEDVGTALRIRLNNGSPDISFVTDNGNWYVETYSSTVNTSTWYYIVGTYNGSDLIIYVNDVSETNSIGSHTVKTGLTKTLIAAYQNSGDFFFDGVIDECHISDTARSAAWIKASYNSQNDSLASYGSIQTNGNAIMFGMGF